MHAKRFNKSLKVSELLDKQKYLPNTDILQLKSDI